MLLKFPARIYICEGPENTIHGERPGDNPGARSDFVIFRITYCKSRNNKTYTSEQLAASPTYLLSPRVPGFAILAQGRSRKHFQKSQFTGIMLFGKTVIHDTFFE